MSVSVALGIQSEMRMRLLSSVDSPASQYFSTSHKQHDFQKKVTEQKMCALIFSTTSVCNTSHFKKN